MRRAKSPSQADRVVTDSASIHAPHRTLFPPLIVWLLLQMLALGLSAARIPFFATKSFPQPAEILAVPLMWTIQIGTSALLFPFLLRDPRAAGLVIAAAWPFTIIAGILTGLPMSLMTVASILFITVWIWGLALWSHLLRSRRAQAVGVCVAVLLAFGGPFLTYVKLEYGNSSVGPATGIDGPISAALVIGSQDPLSQTVWLFTGGYLLVSSIAWGIRKFKKRTP